MLRNVFGLLVFTLIPGAAFADAWQTNWQHCAGSNSELAISGCTALIDANQETPDDLAAAYYNRGWHYADRGDDHKAIADFTQAMQLKPNYADAIENRAHAYKRLGDTKLALADFDKVLELRPGYAEALLARQQCFCGKERLNRRQDASYGGDKLGR